MSRENTQFKKGQSGNVCGRPRGSRNKLSERFLADLEKDWRRNGMDVLSKVRYSFPEVYLKIISTLLSKEESIGTSKAEIPIDYAGAKERLLEKLMRFSKDSNAGSSADGFA